MWDSGRCFERIALRDVRVSLRLGLGAAERLGPQPVAIDLELYRQWRAPPAGIDEALDYDRLFRHLVADLPSHAHVDLVETVAADLAAFCLGDPRVEACRVVIRKLQIYAGRAVPEVELYRVRLSD